MLAWLVLCCALVICPAGITHPPQKREVGWLVSYHFSFRCRVILLRCFRRGREFQECSATFTLTLPCGLALAEKSALPVRPACKNHSGPTTFQVSFMECFLGSLSLAGGAFLLGQEYSTCATKADFCLPLVPFPLPYFPLSAYAMGSLSPPARTSTITETQLR